MEAAATCRKRQEAVKKEKWMRRLSRGTVEKILDKKPDAVTFHVKAPSLISCRIGMVGGEVGMGFAFCSPLEKRNFNLKTGKEKAAERALLALEEKKNSLHIRSEKDCPRRWLPSQVKQLSNFAKYLGHKSMYIRKVTG